MAELVLGYPIGASGACINVTLIQALRQLRLKKVSPVYASVAEKPPPPKPSLMVSQIWLSHFINIAMRPSSQSLRNSALGKPAPLKDCCSR